MASKNTTQLPSRSRPTRPSRQQLLFQFDMSRDAEANNTDRSYFINTSYPPCSQALSELTALTIADLELESHHRGKVLILRGIDEPVRSAAVQTIVEDSSGDVERLAVYNCPANWKPEDYLPDEAVFAVKEPYYEQAGQGSCVRVDHPSDIVRLSPSDPMLPELFRPSESKSAFQWKDEGNKAYGSGDYHLALRLYNNAIDVLSRSNKTENVTLRRLILRNRTMVQFYLGHLEPALMDAQAAIIPQDEIQDAAVDTKRNTTAYFRAGRAAYELHQYNVAEQLFNRALQLSPGDSDSLKELDKIKVRRKEMGGEYDFDAMSKTTSKKHNRLDRADFVSNATVKDAGEGRGRGLFANKDFKAGELITCEKALSVSFDSDVGTSNGYAILSSKTQRRATGTTATLLFQLVDKLKNNPAIAKKFFDLQDDNYTPKVSLEAIDGAVPVDSFRTLAVLDHNCYGCPTVRSSSNAAQAQLASSKGYPSSGMWLHASYINHACNGNAMRSFIGDMMAVRATRDIKVGDEICMPYRLPHPDNSVTQEELQKIWGFMCDCTLCRAEAASPGKDKKQRAELIAKATEFTNKNKHKDGVTFDKKTIEQAARMYDRLEKAHDSTKFDNLPRPGLLGLGLWLCHAYTAANEHDEVAKSSNRLLRDLGLLVRTESDAMAVHRKYCLLEPRAVDAAVYATKSYRAMGDDKASQYMAGLAREFYQTLNGEMRGFDDRYGL
jgi:tetratricopeptide (TPR) repeat protein